MAEARASGTQVEYRLASCAGGGAGVAFDPPSPNPADAFFLTDDPAALSSLMSGTSFGNVKIVGVPSLARMILPETPLGEDGGPGVGGMEWLKRAWGDCQARLDAMPVWAHELLASIAINLDDPGMSALFAHWAESLDCGDGDRRWQSSFRGEQRRVQQRPLPTLDDCTPLDPDEVAEMLGPAGAMAHFVPGYEPRPGQVRMLKAVVEAVNTGRHLVVEAGTGVGKSLAYLLPCALWARLNDTPVVISTNTKNLQAQLVEKDLPAVLKVIGGGNGESLRAAVIKGRSNYLCLRRFGQMVEGGLFDLLRPELRMFGAAVAWAVVTRDGDFDSITGSGAADPQFIQLLASNSEECIGRSCRHYGACFVQRARERALKANLVIANHSLVFAELSAEVPVSLPPHSQLVFDEAHNLEDAATNHFARELSHMAARNATRKLLQSRGRHRRGILPALLSRLESGAIRLPDKDSATIEVGNAMSAVNDFQSAASALLKGIAGLTTEKSPTLRYKFALDGAGARIPSPNPAWKHVDAAAEAFFKKGHALEASLRSLAAIIEGGASGELDLAAGDASDLKAALKRIGDLLDTALFVLDGTDAEYVFWAERPRNGDEASAYAAPVNVGRFLADELYSKLSSVIVCSATLSVSGKFDFSASRLGLDLIDGGRIMSCMAQSPFDYPRQCALLVPEYLPSPLSRDRVFEAELASLVVRLSRHYRGRTMVLFTSYEMMRACAGLARGGIEADGLVLLVQGESGSRNRMTRVFRQDGGSVLFGTQSFWEGVDVMGEALSCVIVAKLPFASPDDPVISARCEAIEANGGNAFFDLSLPLAVLKLRQGFGRLIRHRNDHGSVVIADTRVLTKPYGRVFLRSLPSEAVPCHSADELMEGLK